MQYRKMHVGGGHEDIGGIITNHSNCIISLFFLHSFGSRKCSIHAYFIYVLVGGKAGGSIYWSLLILVHRGQLFSNLPPPDGKKTTTSLTKACV